MQDRHATSDAIVYPICFIYRHLIEIWLKRVIYRYASSVSDDKAIESLKKGNHSLTSLRDRLRSTLQTTGDDTSWLEEFNQLFDDLAVVDPQGASFRYHSRLDGQTELSDASGSPYTYLALDQFAKKAKELFDLLDGAFEVICERTEFDAEDLAEFLC